MRAANTWASGAKLTLVQVEQLRRRKALRWADMAEYAKQWGVCTDTIYRAYVGRSWVNVFAKNRKNEWKHCIMCGKRYQRRFNNGRYRDDRVWAQKVTCSRSCAVAHHWKEGVYANRGK